MKANINVRLCRKLPYCYDYAIRHIACKDVTTAVGFNITLINL